jgi:hypothetical protein
MGEHKTSKNEEDKLYIQKKEKKKEVMIKIEKKERKKQYFLSLMEPFCELL